MRRAPQLESRRVRWLFLRQPGPLGTNAGEQFLPNRREGRNCRLGPHRRERNSGLHEWLVGSSRWPDRVLSSSSCPKKNGPLGTTRTQQGRRHDDGGSFLVQFLGGAQANLRQCPEKAVAAAREPRKGCP